MSAELAFTGDDWQSPVEKKRRERAEADYVKAMQRTAAALDKAADELNSLYRAAIDADLPGVRREGDDSRTLLRDNCREYAGHLNSVLEGRKRGGR